MQLRELKELVHSTSDASFVVDGEGLVVAWNSAAEAMFGAKSQDSVGRPCADLLRGNDECGPVCSLDCIVQQAVRNHRTLSNFDLQVETPHGKKWCNISILIIAIPNSLRPYSMHIVRPIDTRKRLEMLVRDFVITGTAVPAKEAHELIATTRAPAQSASLSERELEVLRMLAKGFTTRRISGQLHISPTTVNNHIQHILKKFNAHTRLEAIRRAEYAGLL